MAEVITLKDGRDEVLSRMEDLYELIGEYMGWEVAEWLEEQIAERYVPDTDFEAMCDEREAELDKMNDHYVSVLSVIHERADEAKELLSEKQLKRWKLCELMQEIASEAGRTL